MNRYIKYILLSIFQILVVGCSDPLDEYYTEWNKDSVLSSSIVDVLEEQKGYTQMVKLLNESGLLESFGSDKPYTLWAAPDSTFPTEEVEAMSAEERRKFVSNHLCTTVLYAKNMKNVDKIRTYADKYFAVEFTEKGFSVGGNKVVQSDILCADGVIHKVANWNIPRQSLYEFYHSLGDDYSLVRDELFSHEEMVMDKDNSVQVGYDEFGQPIYEASWIYKNDYLGDADMRDESKKFTLFVVDNTLFESACAANVARLDVDVPERDVNEELDRHNALSWFASTSLYDGVIEASDIAVDADLYALSGHLYRNTTAYEIDHSVELSNGVVHFFKSSYIPYYANMNAQAFSPYWIRYEATLTGMEIDNTLWNFSSYLYQYPLPVVPGPDVDPVPDLVAIDDVVDPGVDPGVDPDVDPETFIERLDGWSLRLNMSQIPNPLLDNKKLSVPIVWQDAPGWYEFYACDYDVESRELSKIKFMPGTYKIKSRLTRFGTDNMYRMKLFINDSADVDGYLASEEYITISDMLSGKYDVDGGEVVSEAYDLKEYGELKLRYQHFPKEETELYGFDMKRLGASYVYFTAVDELNY